MSWQALISHYCCCGELNLIFDHISVPSPPNRLVETGLHNFTLKEPPFQGCGKCDVWSQFDGETQDPYAWFLPHHFGLLLLHQAYPNATFVMNILAAIPPLGPRVFCTGIR
jgi:hypothetical protein